MRQLLFASIILLTGSQAFSKKVEWIPPYFEIVSDSYQPSVPEGYFRITGVVKDVVSGQVIPGSYVTNFATTHMGHSNDEGAFSVLIPVEDSVVYCYAPGYGELEIRGPFKEHHLLQVRAFLQQQVAVAYKPVIYAYNTPGDVKLSLKPQGRFTFTYPQAADGTWHINTNADGTLNNLADGKKYPYLFWEGEIIRPEIDRDYYSTATGFLIKTDSCISFLENTLAKYGLNEKESTDLITFWGPKMAEKPYAFVQFLGTASYSSHIATLDIEPMPETLLRLYLLITPLEDTTLPFDVVEPEIEPLTRSGFTVIEWGGSMVPLSEKLN